MKSKSVLIVDDQEDMRFLLSLNLENMGYGVDTANDGFHCIEMMKMGNYDAVLLDIQMPDKDGMETLKEIRRDFPNVSVIMVTALAEISLAVQAVKLGADEYVTKPIDFEELETDLRNAIETKNLKQQVTSLKNEIKSNRLFTDMIDQSPAMQDVLQLTDRVLNSDASILIIGESGTGKEVLAHAIHNGSNRNSKPFVPVNSAAISKESPDSLLFGHKKGAFTGAIEDQAGYFEPADGGTIFLDEIGDMDLEMQAKVLRVLEEKTIRRIGEEKEREVDFRIMAATNRDLAQSIKENRFRKDLYFRLEEYPIYLPPLRERQNDVLLLAQNFVDEYCHNNQQPAKQIGDEVKQIFKSHDWPGNIRELKNVIRRAAIREPGQMISEITFSNINSDHEASQTRPVSRSGDDTPAVIPFDLVEKQAIENAYLSTDPNVVRAARLLGISRATMYRKLKQYDQDFWFSKLPKPGNSAF